MIIVRFLASGPFGWLAPPKFTRVQGADIVMESFHLTVGQAVKSPNSSPDSRWEPQSSLWSGSVKKLKHTAALMEFTCIPAGCLRTCLYRAIAP